MILQLFNSQKIRRPQKIYRGETLIGILIGIALISILIHVSFTLISSLYTIISFNRARLTAKHLAQEKMELIRNLPYDQVGTQGGIPSGSLPQAEIIRKNGLNFNVETDIIYIDDPFDDISPTDLLPTDYKRVRVDISWDGISPSKNPVVFVTDIAPKGVESSEGGGTLSILVFNADGLPVNEAEVHIVASSVTPAVDLELHTGQNGRIILPGAPECISCYEINVNKSGYSTEKTYSNAEVENPNKPHQSVFEGELTEVSFDIDRTSSLNITTSSDRESDFALLGNVSLTIRGSKTIGTDQDENPIYKYTETITTNAGGNITISDLEWDQYHITTESTLFNISGTNPFLPISISPNSDQNILISLSSYSVNNLLLKFVNTSDNQIATVGATLIGTDFEETVFSGGQDDPDFGQAFFADLLDTTYNFTATASGYLDFSGTIPVEGTTTETIILTPE